MNSIVSLWQIFTPFICCLHGLWFIVSSTYHRGKAFASPTPVRNPQRIPLFLMLSQLHQSVWFEGVKYSDVAKGPAKISFSDQRCFIILKLQLPFRSLMRVVFHSKEKEAKYGGPLAALRPCQRTQWHLLQVTWCMPCKVLRGAIEKSSMRHHFKCIAYSRISTSDICWFFGYFLLISKTHKEAWLFSLFLGSLA